MAQERNPAHGGNFAVGARSERRNAGLRIRAFQGAANAQEPLHWADAAKRGFENLGSEAGREEGAKPQNRMTDPPKITRADLVASYPRPSERRRFLLDCLKDFDPPPPEEIYRENLAEFDEAMEAQIFDPSAAAGTRRAQVGAALARALVARARTKLPGASDPKARALADFADRADRELGRVMVEVLHAGEAKILKWLSKRIPVVWKNGIAAQPAIAKAVDSLENKAFESALEKNDPGTPEEMLDFLAAVDTEMEELLEKDSLRDSLAWQGVDCSTRQMTREWKKWGLAHLKQKHGDKQNH
jgi:hypothetical protein